MIPAASASPFHPKCGHLGPKDHGCMAIWRSPQLCAAPTSCLQWPSNLHCDTSPPHKAWCHLHIEGGGGGGGSSPRGDMALPLPFSFQLLDTILGLLGARRDRYERHLAKWQPRSGSLWEPFPLPQHLYLHTPGSLPSLPLR